MLDTFKMLDSQPSTSFTKLFFANLISRETEKVDNVTALQTFDGWLKEHALIIRMSSEKENRMLLSYRCRVEFAVDEKSTNSYKVE